MHDPAHATAAVTARTGIAFAVVDRKTVLKIAELAVGLDVIA